MFPFCYLRLVVIVTLREEFVWLVYTELSWPPQSWVSYIEISSEILLPVCLDFKETQGHFRREYGFRTFWKELYLEGTTYISFFSIPEYPGDARQ